MKTKLLHMLRESSSKRFQIDEKLTYGNLTIMDIIKDGKIVFTADCFPDDYNKTKKLVFNKCDELIRESILKELNWYKKHKK